MSKLNRTCVICGNKYSYCFTCSTHNMPTWKAEFCDENCREIYHICVEYDSNKITKEEALRRLNKCDISAFDKYTDSTKKIIRKIKENNNQQFNKQKKYKKYK